MIILDSAKSDTLRYRYVEKFVDTDSIYYKERIEQRKVFSDGLCYTGYIWDCLRNPCAHTEQEADSFMHKKRNFYVMWDIHSCDRIFIPDYWKFPKTSVLSFDVWIVSMKTALPEDIYLFDETFSWSVIYTHETNEKEDRYCLLI